MNYFTLEQHTALITLHVGAHGFEAEIQSAYQRLLDLHSSLYPRIRKHGFNLHIDAFPASLPADSAAGYAGEAALAMGFMRSQAQAQGIQGRLGLEGSVDPRRHPVIELRLTPHVFAVELVVSPDAWLDQQNFAGKLMIDQHRTAFIRQLMKLDDDYRFGFWGGVELNDMHLSTNRLPSARVINEWLSTFAPGRDYLRIGRWYDLTENPLEEHGVINQLFDHIRNIYGLYEFITWSSNNNYIDFYERALRTARA